MNLRQYKFHLEQYIHANPGCLDDEVVFAVDDEGNDFRPVVFSPTRGNFNNGEFRDKLHVDSDDELNTTCIN